jgi:hypothetical protein
MTESNFIALHFPTGQENIAGTLHLNVNQVGETQQGIISSIIIHVNAFSINGNENDKATYIENVLEQIESVKFTSLGITYELIINSRSYYPAQNPFFYFTIEPAYIPDIFDANQFIASIEDVTLTPYLLDVQFGFSEFNPLISNASIGRKSNIIMQSDRLEQTVLPANINALLSESAVKASVQDSLYTDTGWTNARYIGSETSAAESAGIPPSITGRSFTGEVFSSDSDTEYICSTDNKLNQQLFHTSDTELPAFELDSDITIELAVPFGRYQTQLTYQEFPASGSIDLGDVLKVTSGAYLFEYIRIKEINTQLKKITVDRDIYNAYLIPDFRPASYNVGIEWTKVKRFDIFRFENTGQNRIQLVNNSRIYINGNNTIVDTDDFGQIVSSSICPAPGYIVD